jgi:hypothetical protein
MAMFSNILKRTADNSYVLDRNGMPYHVPNEGEFTSLWKLINAYANAHPGEVTLEYPPPPPPEPTPDEREAEFKSAVQQRLNAFAGEKDYNLGIAAAIAVSKDSSKYAADCAIMQAAYDHSWEAAYNLLPNVRSGEFTIEQALAQLPVLTWEG